MAATITEIADRYVDEAAALDPFLATYVGVPGHDDQVPDLSPSGVEARADHARRTLRMLDEAEPGGERERIAREVMRERLSLEVERAEAGVPYADLNVIASDLQATREVFDVMPTGDDRSWAVVARRMARVPDALDGLAQTYREGARRGLVPARTQVLACARQCDTWSGRGGEPGFFTAMVAGAGATGGLAADLQAAARAAEAAYARFGDVLRAELAAAARDDDACGPERYGLAARTFLGAEVDLDEAYRWGWEELARIDAEKDAEAARLGAGSWREAADRLRADPGRVLEGTDALLRWMQALADRAVADLHGTHFDIPEPVRTLRCAIAPPGGNSGAYYVGPTEDFSRPGTMWWAPTPGQSRFHPWMEVTTVFHEGVPGHHLQIGQATWQAGDLTRFQRVLCFVSGHGEGWALYAERLMDELGHLADPAERLGMLDAQALRAARVVVDIGAHLRLEIPPNPWRFHEGERWTPAAMRELLSERTLLEPGYVADEVNRYLGWPGQAISYKVGERLWMQARDEWRRRDGAAFDLKRFHAVALGLGPMGLDTLLEELRRPG